MKILVTGTSGFIGFHLAGLLLSQGHEVVGLDIINDYYDINLKYDRLAHHGIARAQAEVFGKMTDSATLPGYRFIRMDLTDKASILSLFKVEKFDAVVNLAAQAGVRYSLTNPDVYIDSNITGFLQILEACRAYPVKHLVYASSSSVYGLNQQVPFSVHESTEHPMSLYAASKKSNEMMAHVYSNLFGVPTTGLRFFTVYGPWGRPDMALFIFTNAILKGEPIQVFNHGQMSRDFTYVADIVESISRLIHTPPTASAEFNPLNPDPAISSVPYRIFNIGNNSPVKLMDFVRAIENKLGIEAKIDFQPLQDGDVPNTYADVHDLIDTVNFKPSTSVEEGINRFIDWYVDYYKVKV